MMRSVRALGLCAVVVGVNACQSPTSPGTSFNVDNFVDGTVSPNPTTATADTDGRTYRVVLGNNQPDQILPYQFITTFSVVLTINGSATNSTNNIKFPVTITSSQAKVQQASGGIVSTPTGGDTEHFDSVILSSTTSTISQVGSGAQLVIKVWYTLPDNGKEALITESVALKDSSDTPQTFTKNVQVLVSP
jgi:hypothetical protein